MTESSPETAARPYLLVSSVSGLFCVDMLRVRGVVEVGEITRVPGAPVGMAGVVNVGGRVMALGDLGLLLGSEAIALDDRSTALILDPDVPDGAPLALLADVQDVAEVSDAKIEATPAFGLGPGADLVSGVGHLDQDRLALMLDVDRLFEVLAGEPAT